MGDSVAAVLDAGDLLVGALAADGLAADGLVADDLADDGLVADGLVAGDLLFAGPRDLAVPSLTRSATVTAVPTAVTFF